MRMNKSTRGAVPNNKDKVFANRTSLLFGDPKKKKIEGGFEVGTTHNMNTHSGITIEKTCPVK